PDGPWRGGWCWTAGGARTGAVRLPRPPHAPAASVTLAMTVTLCVTIVPPWSGLHRGVERHPHDSMCIQCTWASLSLCVPLMTAARTLVDATARYAGSLYIAVRDSEGAMYLPRTDIHPCSTTTTAIACLSGMTD